MRNDPYGTRGMVQCCPRPESEQPVKYNNIARGTTVKIPVTVRTADGQPINLSGYTVYFTLKAKKGDMVFDDSTALVTRTFQPQDPTNGKFYVVLSARDTWLVPSFYYFDFELEKDESVVRLGNFVTQIVDGVTNRSVIGASINESVVSILDEITVNQGIADNIIVVSNFNGSSAGAGIPEIPLGVNTEYIRARDGNGAPYWKEHVTTGDGKVYVFPLTSYINNVALIERADIIMSGIDETAWDKAIVSGNYPEVHFYMDNTLLTNNIEFTSTGDVKMIIRSGGATDGTNIRMVMIWQESKATSRETFSIVATLDATNRRLRVSASDLTLAGVNMVRYLRALANYEFPEIHFYHGNTMMVQSYYFESDGAIVATVDPADITQTVHVTMTLVC